MNSRIVAIANHDLRVTLRSRALWLVYPLVLLLLALPTWSDTGTLAFDFTDIGHLTWQLRVYTVLLVGITAYNAIAGERESGTIRLSLGLPGTRRDVLVGKLLSRVVVVIVALVPLLVLLDVVFLVRLGETYLATYLPVALWTLLYAVVWTGFAVGVSALVSSRRRALIAIGATYFVFSPETQIWRALVRPVLALLVTGTLDSRGFLAVGSGTAPTWTKYAERLNPVSSYTNGGIWLAGIGESVEPSMTAAPNLFGLVVLVCFGVLPLVVGYRRFERADLG